MSTFKQLKSSTHKQTVILQWSHYTNDYVHYFKCQLNWYKGFFESVDVSHNFYHNVFSSTNNEWNIACGSSPEDALQNVI